MGSFFNFFLFFLNRNEVFESIDAVDVTGFDDRKDDVTNIRPVLILEEEPILAINYGKWPRPDAGGNWLKEEGKSPR